MVLPKSFTTVTTFSKILAMILFILLPFVGFYIGYKYNGLTYSNTPVIQNNLISTPAITSGPNPTTDSTANWKTYTNNPFGYSLDYPEGWKIGEQQYGGVGIGSGDYKQGVFSNSAKSGFKILVAAGQKSNNECQTTNASGVSDLKSVMIQNQPAFKYHLDYEAHSLAYCFYRNKYAWYIYFIAKDVSEEQKYQNIIDKVVSSLNFSE